MGRVEQKEHHVKSWTKESVENLKSSNGESEKRREAPRHQWP